MNQPELNEPNPQNLPPPEDWKVIGHNPAGPVFARPYPTPIHEEAAKLEREYVKKEAAVRDKGLNTVPFMVEIPATHYTPEVAQILNNYLPDIIRMFAAKNADYNSGAQRISDPTLDVPSQWLKMVGKLDKLRRPLWEDRGVGPEMQFESVTEILGDLVGHILLEIMYYNKARTK